jgi:spore photoproduct lyase
MPERALFESSALKHDLGIKLWDYFNENGIETVKTSPKDISSNIPGETTKQKYARSKKTIVITTKKSLKLDECRPSADYEFSLVTNCPGHCEYCYLQTTQGYKPYLKVYVNLDEIFESIKKHMEKSEKKPVVFEAASSGDPLALEHITGSLAKTIEFFGSLEGAKLRVVTKYDNVDSLLALKHNGKTRFRFSVNTRHIIGRFEHNTASFEERVEAASKISGAAYPTGFIIAPIMIYDGWKQEYLELFDRLHRYIDASKSSEPLTFELIQHRFTSTAKKFILERFPNTKLDMDESKRMLKWGKYGRFKYVYTSEEAKEVREYIKTLIKERFPDAVVEYFT